MVNLRRLELVVLLLVGCVAYGAVWTEGVSVIVNDGDSLGVVFGGACCRGLTSYACTVVGDNTEDCIDAIKICHNEPPGTGTCGMTTTAQCDEDGCVSTGYDDKCTP